MSIAHKEARESAYWLRLIDEAHLGRVQDVERMIDETRQLIRILSSITDHVKAIKKLKPQNRGFT